MTVAQAVYRITPEEYLAGELQSEVRHEYFAGEIFAMAGASLAHNRISGNVFAALHARLAGRRCEAFMNDMKVHIRSGDDDWFYYPDVLVSCNPSGLQKHHCDTPAIVFEVLSPETEAIDRREKLRAYQSLPSLSSYVLVAQDRREVIVFRRGESDWTREILTESEGVLRLPEIEFEIGLEAIYARVEL